VLTLGFAAGCGAFDGISDDPSPSTGPSGGQRSGAPALGEVLDDIKGAEKVVNEYWTRHWSDFFTGPYRAPRVVGLYDGAAPDAPTCGGEKLKEDNAFYCAPEDFVAWDGKLMSRAAQVGDSWVYLVIAHEWGHAIQARLSRELNSPAAELQADCLAGSVLYGAARDGRLVFEQGDEKEIAAGLTAIADETPWTDPTSHGDVFQRIQSFSQGRTGGVPACIPSG
jgi:predicted metalloprotease